ncbi:ABC transporter permease [Amycolatopsis regifaucium]|uniref:Peptide ABC transporter permease n=1 Tax=Amycolatopsis regifaucium TaxID=546365 RepID=A0A154MPZ7_9PSEU|nr:ABC transporter permease [Amycolatopsis regifaucium]KZB86013.1 peptide ABC transporter permease [Amycolatopsis regifaucium]OKA04904.1 peptide ABC transporter permease [Amycolatopsis regifaucium]SFH74815.1 peptide/nickel transport system permease protein [Amycolatopsis regifaucium]
MRTREVTVLGRALRTGQARLGLTLLAMVALVVAFGPFFAPYAPDAIVGPPLETPSTRLLLGTDILGRDVLSRLLNGGFALSWMAVLAAALGVVLGCVVGLTAAYRGGGVDAVLMRSMDVLLSFPEIIFVLLFVSMLGRSTLLTAVLVGVAFVPGVSRVMRGAALPVVGSEYVLWAKANGLPLRRLLLREVLPGVTSPLMVETGMRLVWAVSAIASLSYLGFGIAPPAADWGRMVGENQDGLPVAPLAVLAPIALILMMALGGNLVAESVARAVGRTEGKV